MTIFYQTDYITILYDEERKLGRSNRIGFVSGEPYRESALKTIEVISKFNLTKFISDTRKMKAIRQQDQEWTVKEFTPLLVQSSVRKIAGLVSEDIFNKMAVKQIIQRISPQPALEIRQFQYEKDALEWLEAEDE